VPAAATQGGPVGPMFGWLGLTARWFRGRRDRRRRVGAGARPAGGVGSRGDLPRARWPLGFVFGLAGFFAEPVVVVSATPGLLG